MCDVEEVGKVWTVFQRRYDGSVSFDRNYTDYDAGFGNVSGEFWLGLRNLKHLLGNRTVPMKITMVDRYYNRKYVRNYSAFGIGEAPGYKLSVRGYSESHGLAEYGSGYNFSTPDFGTQKSCAKSYGGGWWIESCNYNNLNGRNHTSSGFVWYDLHGSASGSYNLRESEMKILV